LQKVHHRDATLLSAATVFDMATAGGARAARLDAGVLRPGKLADVVILDLDGPHIGPVNDLLQTIVYCSKASDVRTTIIDGRILMRDRRILPVDEPAIIGRARELAAEYQRRAVGKQLKTQF
ncbi:MAG TPA: amidohydrolase family protein, partial [Bacillota bacterium]